ncbi:hypothetical protein C8J57DRAFT_1358585, partial [Mycena rebaudengoi]
MAGEWLHNAICIIFHFILTVEPSSLRTAQKPSNGSNSFCANSLLCSTHLQTNIQDGIVHQKSQTSNCKLLASSSMRKTKDPRFT